MQTIYERIPSTRYELLRLREFEADLRAGFDILKNKEEILLKEFFDAAKDVHEKRDILDSNIKRAYTALVEAQKVHGVLGTKYLAAATQPGTPPVIETRKIAGVSIPSVKHTQEKRNVFCRGYAPSSSSLELETAASLFEVALSDAIQVGEKEARTEKLGNEVLKARRRSRALEKEILPEVLREKQHIKESLDMRSRETFVRTKKIKAMTGS